MIFKNKDGTIYKIEQRIEEYLLDLEIQCQISDIHKVLNYILDMLEKKKNKEVELPPPNQGEIVIEGG